jgi:hypothetical protein
MTKEKLLARKREAEKAKEQALANLYHWSGVIADCDHWLEAEYESVEQNGGKSQGSPASSL